MQKEQLELSFDRVVVPAAASRCRVRSSRATWWFRQMRRVVNRACDWQSAPPPRPAQTYLCLAGESAFSHGMHGRAR